jgi:hypothetical protein
MSKKKQDTDTQTAPAGDATEALRKQVAPVLRQYPRVPWFRVSADGKVFLPHQQRPAERYAERYKQELTIIYQDNDG